MASSSAQSQAPVAPPVSAVFTRSSRHADFIEPVSTAAPCSSHSTPLRRSISRSWSSTSRFHDSASGARAPASSERAMCIRAAFAERRNSNSAYGARSRASLQLDVRGDFINSSLPSAPAMSSGQARRQFQPVEPSCLTMSSSGRRHRPLADVAVTWKPGAPAINAASGVQGPEGAAALSWHRAAARGARQRIRSFAIMQCTPLLPFTVCVMRRSAASEQRV